MAAMVKNRMGLGGMVHTVDPLDRLYFQQHKWYSTDKDKRYPTLDQLLWNFGAFNVADNIVFYQMRSASFPFEDHKLCSAFIDGAHDFDSALADWQNCKKHCDLIMFHDYTDGSSWEDIKKVVDQYALKDPDFEALAHVDTCIAFVRKDNAK